MIKEIKFTDKALKQINVLLSKKDKGSFFRIAIKGGGCSGFQYEISLSDPTEEDLVIEGGGEKVIIDTASLPFLENAIIDYADELIGARFVIENPNATSSCGCGTSFSI